MVYLAVALFVVTVALAAYLAGMRAHARSTFQLLNLWEQGKRDLPPGPPPRLATAPAPDRRALNGRARPKGKKR